MALKPHKEILLDIIFAANAAQIPYAELAVSDARVNDDPDAPGDTAVVITSLNEKRYLGSVTATFDKLDIDVLFEQIGVADLDIEAFASTTHDLLLPLQDKYNWSVFAEDIVDEPIAFDDQGKATIILKAAETSLFYKGEILAGVSVPKDIPLSEVIQVSTLSGLNYPTQSVA